MKKLLLVVLVALGSMALAGCDWPQIQGNAARTGFQPFETEIGPSTVASLAQVWSVPLGATGSSPVVANGKVYVGTSDLGGSGRGSIRAYDATGQTGCSGTPKTCTALWGVTTDVGVGSSMSVVNGVLYAVDGLGVLYAIDAEGPSHCGGESAGCPVLWAADTGYGGGGAPAVVGSLLFVGSGSNRLSVYDARGVANCSGTTRRFCAPLWTATTNSPIRAVAVDRGVVYAVTADGALYAYGALGQTNCSGTPKECQPLWSATAGSAGGVPRSPVVGGGTVYTMEGSGLLRAFDALGVTNCSGTPTTCAPLWSAQVFPPTSDTYFSQAPALANGRLYAWDAVYDAQGITNCAGTPKVCAPLWRVSTGGQSPIVANGLEFTGGSEPPGGGAVLPLTAFDANGTDHCSGTPSVCAPLWTVPVGRLSSSPAVANGVLYVVTTASFPDTGYLRAYAPS